MYQVPSIHKYLTLKIKLQNVDSKNVDQFQSNKKESPTIHSNAETWQTNSQYKH
jgi:hypothetical protein